LPTKTSKTFSFIAPHGAALGNQNPQLKLGLSKNEPKEYVSKDKNGGAHKKNKQTGGALVPNFFPLYVLGLLLEESNSLFANLADLRADFTEEILNTFHNNLHSAASATSKLSP
jgi:hypothetical protein